MKYFVRWSAFDRLCIIIQNHFILFLNIVKYLMMGNYFGNYPISPPQPEPTEDDDFLPFTGSETETTDAVETNNKLNASDVMAIESELDFLEKVSMVYLLYDDAYTALQYLLKLEKGLSISVLCDWIQLPYNSKTKLLEALAVIQNYKLLHSFGYTVLEINQRFLPFNTNTSIEIDKTKKMLYRICEEFKPNDLQKFLLHVEEDFKTKNLCFKRFPGSFLEMYLLYWNTIKYISPINYTNLAKIFKQMEMYTISEYLYSVGKSPSTIGSIVRPLNTTYMDNTSNRPVSRSRSNSSSASIFSSYQMNENTPGLCLIINQEMFFTEPDPCLQHLLPDIDGKLETRLGTTVDCARIKNTMSKFGFTVIEKNNLDHNAIQSTIQEVVQAVRKEDSSLFIFILSHGKEGGVYGSNSIPVNVTDIQKIVCNTNIKNLSHKPKTLIIQACQGTLCQEVNQFEANDIEMDGPIKILSATPKLADSLEFWATVPGYGAIRDKTKGTWFIQSFCDKLEANYAEFHFEDICTMVIQDVVNKRWGNKAMVPIKKSTLTASLFFPKMR